ncbi:MAG: histidine phosphatase family protein [Xanthobacteraceae bacterium]
MISRPVIYYVRHGLTDWNVQQRLQGRHDVPLNAQGCTQATHCGEILRELLRRDGKSADRLGYVSSPLVRARRTMELIRTRLALLSDGYCVDERLAEIAFGEWEGLTYAEVLARDKDVVARREANKWDFLPLGGESYAQVTRRIAAWCDSLERDTVVVAHGGTARALIAHLALVPVQDATHHPIDQGVVYVFAGGSLERYR